jgi:hypothetical protein
MKTLRESLTMTEAYAVSLLRQVTKDGSTYVLKLKAVMTPAMADALRCRNQVYTLNDNPCPGLQSLKLDHEISSCELMALRLTLTPSIVTGFTIQPAELADSDGDLELHFRMKFSQGRKELNALLDTVANNPFELTLMALQGNLFDAESTSAGDGPDGGTKVDMTEEETPPEEPEEEELPRRGRRKAVAV